MDVDYRAAGAASLTLLDCIMTHFEDKGVFSEAERDSLFEDAVSAHEQADIEQPDPVHTTVIHLLQRLQTRSDGMRVVGTSSRKDGKDGVDAQDGGLWERDGGV